MNILLQAGGVGSGILGNPIILMVILIAVFYFFMIRPQQKKQKELQKAREAMKVGDKVVTAGGIHGRIKEIGETWISVEVADGVRIKFEKTSVFASSSDAATK